jgi:glutamate synthase (NADPH/NADH) small chain
METSQEYLASERAQTWREDLRKSVKAADRTKKERVKMPEQDPDVRNKNSLEVNLGISETQALAEAARCLDCVTPTCITGCPVNINIPKFIKKIESGDFAGAAKVLKETNALPAVCGRVCPQEVQCESQCFYVQKMKKPAVAIGNLERFAADFERESGQISVPEVAPRKGIKVGVVGSGPSGLAAAGDLIKMGYDVTVFEALHEIGGVLKYGIPEFRLPNVMVDVEIENLRQMGVVFEPNFIVGKTASLDTLRAEGYKAFFIGSGAGLPNFMHIPGENAIGIFSSNEYLTRVNLMGASRPGYDTPVLKGRNVAVIGGGNTAMDSVRTAKRLDASGRRRPVPREGSEFLLDVDTVIVSIGVSPNPLIPQAVPGLEVTRWGTLVVNPDTMQTSIPDLFAGGDIVRGGATVILAMGDGRKAAAGMDAWLKEQNI